MKEKPSGNGSPRYFTKILKLPISLLRSLQIRVLIYIDDLLIVVGSREEAIFSKDTAIFLLENLGFTINLEKSVLIPNQQMEYLVVWINRFPPKKVKNWKMYAFKY